jgi:branched-chain amino acid transport system permease protein
MNAYIIHLLILICIYAILAVSLNLAVGYAGLLNLGHIAFFAVGAYTSALLVQNGAPYMAALLLAGCFAAVFGYLLILGTYRLKGDYLALATLGFSFVVSSILLNWTWLTRGPLGIPGIPKPNVFGFQITNNTAFLLFAAVLCAITYFIFWRITKSSYGTALQAMRDDELGMKVLGKNTFKLKWQSMAMSAFFAGIAGSLFAHYISFIDPSSFTLSEIILVFTIVIVGGLVSIRGSFIATIIIILIPEALRFLSLPSSILGPMRQIIYAVILLAILFLRPRGLFGEVDLE